jgi:CPA2 family monovalent cation:H+ antiporter-2
MCTQPLRDHVVIIGCGRVGRYVVEVLLHLEQSCLVIELDAGRVAELRHGGIPTLYGDAANSDILLHAHLAEARVVIVTLSDEPAAESSVATVHDMAPQVPLLVRATTKESVRRLLTLGASTVIYPELEGGLQLLGRVLVRLGYSEQEVLQYTQVVRADHYDLSVSAQAEQEALAQLETDRSYVKRMLSLACEILY